MMSFIQGGMASALQVHSVRKVKLKNGVHIRLCQILPSALFGLLIEGWSQGPRGCSGNSSRLGSFANVTG